MKILFALSVCLVAITASPLPEDEVAPRFDPVTETRFLVFTRFNPLRGQEVFLRDMDSVRQTNFDARRPTRFIIHGWQSDEHSEVNFLIANGYLTSYDVNVIVVDWSVGANTINYIFSRNQVGPVGIVVAEFIDNLHNAGLVDFSRLSLVGHSLGAHIAGHVGKNLRRGRIHTIIGLDPAGPLFDANNPNTRLDANDAEYVEIIHTDTRSLGIAFPIGDADFYPK